MSKKLELRTARAEVCALATQRVAALKAQSAINSLIKEWSDRGVLQTKIEHFAARGDPENDWQARLLQDDLDARVLPWWDVPECWQMHQRITAEIGAIDLRLVRAGQVLDQVRIKHDVVVPSRLLTVYGENPGVPTDYMCRAWRLDAVHYKRKAHNAVPYGYGGSLRSRYRGLILDTVLVSLQRLADGCGNWVIDCDTLSNRTLRRTLISTSKYGNRVHTMIGIRYTDAAQVMRHKLYLAGPVIECVGVPTSCVGGQVFCVRVLVQSRGYSARAVTQWAAAPARGQGAPTLHGTLKAACKKLGERRRLDTAA